jgi:hypothetical protein
MQNAWDSAIPDVLAAHLRLTCTGLPNRERPSKPPSFRPVNLRLTCELVPPERTEHYLPGTPA